MSEVTARQGFAVWLILSGISIAAFRLAPDLDLTVSAAFVSADGGFVYARNPAWQLVSAVQVAASVTLVMLSLVCLATGCWRGRPILRLPVRYYAFALLLYLAGPVVAVNLFLKRVSGRARPDAIEAFGGERQFSPAWTFADQCMSNCSFVSAEVASTTALVVSLMLAARLSGSIIWGSFAALALCLLPLVMLQRIGSGRHFLSDTMFAVLIVTGLGLMLWRIAAMPRRVPQTRNLS
jgi:lipid A 4'-phosphatase